MKNESNRWFQCSLLVSLVNAFFISIGAHEVRSPQAIGPVNVTSVTFSDSFFIPPDSDMGVGPAQFLTVVNGRIRSHSKLTGAADGVIDTTLDNFFSSVANGASTSDPHCTYDRLSARWFIVCINVQNGSNRILLAVSNSATITNSTVWNFFFLDQQSINPAGDTGLFFDFPTLGIDQNALYIGGNLFDSNDNYADSIGVVIQKSSALGTGPLVATAFRNFANTGGPVTPQGADNYDGTAAQGFFVGNINNATLGLRIVSNPGSTTPAISSVIAIPVSSFAEPIPIPALGSQFPLDSVDSRLSHVHIRNNQLWAIHSVGLSNNGTSTGTITRDGCRWYQFNIATPTAPSLVQSGTLYDASSSNPLSYWIPSLISSGQGHVAIGCSVAGTQVHANAATVGRLASDPAGTLETPVQYTNSNAPYNIQTGGVQRWGDYSVTAIDSEDNMTMWTIQEFCNATNSWACQVAQLLAPPPANVSSATPPVVSHGLSSVLVTINGSSVNGSGFYDPGAGFSKHLTALVSGGVIVNGVTFVNPTQVILDLNTTVATTGVKTVIIKNPDGQTAMGNVLIAT